MESNSKGKQERHRFIDEAGDMTFGRKKHGESIITIGDNGVSRVFMIGAVAIEDDMEEARGKIRAFCHETESSEFFSRFPSVAKRVEKTGFYYPHACKDPAELRYEFLRFMQKEIGFSASIVVGRKLPPIWVSEHHCNEREFYADLMSHLLSLMPSSVDPLILNIADRGNSTSNTNLQNAVDIARGGASHGSGTKQLASDIRFNVQNYDREPLLALIDYCLWTVQRVYEKGDDKYLTLLQPKIKLVLDVYDRSKREHPMSYTDRDRLTPQAIGFDSWVKPTIP